MPIKNIFSKTFLLVAILLSILFVKGSTDNQLQAAFPLGLPGGNEPYDASGKACAQSESCVLREGFDAQNTGSYSSALPVVFVAISAQDYFYYYPPGENDGCYDVSITNSNTLVSWNKVGSGPGCQDVSNVQIWFTWPANYPTPTPALGPTNTPTPTPITNLSCNQSCTGSSQCASAYCYLGACRNSSCSTDTTCLCAAPTNTPTPSNTPTPTPTASCSITGVPQNTNIFQILYDAGYRTLISGQSYPLATGLSVTFNNQNYVTGEIINLDLEIKTGLYFAKASTTTGPSSTINSVVTFNTPIYITQVNSLDNDPTCAQQGMRATVNGNIYNLPNSKQYDALGNCTGKGPNDDESGALINATSNTVSITSDDSWHYSVSIAPCSTALPTSNASVSPVSCDLYMIQDSSNSNSQFVSIDSATNTASPIGPEIPLADYEGTDIDPSTNELYTLQRRGSDAGWLFKIDATTGSRVRVGYTGSRSTSSMTFRQTDASLWMWYYNGLYQINKNTGARTLSYSYALPSARVAAGDRIEGIAWNNTGTLLYAVVDNYAAARSELWVYDPSARTFTFLSNNLPYRSEGLEMRPDGYLMVGIDNGASSISIISYDVTNLQSIGTYLANSTLNDVESLAWPNSCGNPFPSCYFDLIPSSTNMSVGSTQSLLVSNVTSGEAINRVEFVSSSPAVTINPASDASASYATVASASSSGNAVITANMYTGASVTPVCTATSTITVSGVAPWWQSKGADIITSSNVQSTIPATCVSPTCVNTLLTTDTAYGHGILMAQGTVNTGTGTVSTNGWHSDASNTDTISSVSYFENKLRNIPITNLTSSQITNVSTLTNGTQTGNFYYVKYDGNSFGNAPLEINADLDLGSSKVILLVDNADLEINGDILVQNGIGFFMTIVRHDIFVSETVGGPQEATPLPDLEGIFVSQGDFHTGTTGLGDQQLHIRGAVVAIGNVILERNLSDNSQTPAELIEWTPDMVMLFPSSLSESSVRWQEVAP